MVEGEACDLRAVQLSCCRQYCHRKCLEGWYNRGHHSCPFCRQLNDVSGNGEDPIPPVPGNLSREQVIERLEQLLSDVNLRQEIERVSNMLFLFFSRYNHSEWCGRSSSKWSFLVFLGGV